MQILSSCPGAPQGCQKVDGLSLAEKLRLYIITCVLGCLLWDSRIFVEILIRIVLVRVRIALYLTAGHSASLRAGHRAWELMGCMSLRRPQRHVACRPQSLGVVGLYIYIYILYISTQATAPSCVQATEPWKMLACTSRSRPQRQLACRLQSLGNVESSLASLCNAYQQVKREKVKHDSR